MREKMEILSSIELTKLAAEVVSAYVANNPVPTGELPDLIDKVITSLGAGAQTKNEQRPAVPIKKSVQHEYIICLEDGKQFKSLKRHLMCSYGLTPELYREKWGLSSDYPMVAPAYAEIRSRLAREKGLGRKSEICG